MQCSKCRKTITPPAAGSVAAGYAVTSSGRKICYQCSAKAEVAFMLRHGRTILYWDRAGRQITDWPGVLRFPIIEHRERRHNWWMVGKKHYLYFVGPDGKTWMGTNAGDMDIVRARRLKT